MPTATYGHLVRARELTSRASLAVIVGLVASPVSAEPGTELDDRFELSAHSTTYVRYFERALLPGPGGAQVSPTTLVPVYEYGTLRATDLDAPWAEDSLDVELSLWGSWLTEDVDGDRRFDGDVTVANVRQRLGPAYVKLGRQIITGGAARFSRFDGVSAGALTGFGLGADAYAGLTVLPRWSDRPGYRHLGSAPDSLLRSPDALPEPNRSGYWLAGARSFYAYDRFGEIGVSFHEEHEDSALGHRNAAADLRVSPMDAAALTAQAVLDADSAQVADGRVVLSAYPVPEVTATGEFLHADPALFLSRQSVLGVFATDDFDEVGGELSYRPMPALVVSGASYVQFFGSERHGVRARGRVRALPDGSKRLVLLLGLGHVTEPDNGYSSARVSVQYRIVEPVVLTAEHYTYYYDTAIRNVSTSFVEAGNAEWDPTRSLRLLLGASVTRSPYAAADVQTLLRVTYAFDTSTEVER